MNFAYILIYFVLDEIGGNIIVPATPEKPRTVRKCLGMSRRGKLLAI